MNVNRKSLVYGYGFIYEVQPLLNVFQDIQLPSVNYINVLIKEIS